MKISFHGGAQEVTGACHLLETKDVKILLDCGLFQGGRTIQEHNYENFGFNPAEIDFLCVSHAHLDHIGRIPKLVKEGFKGIIYSTAPTRDLARPLLDDALELAGREDREIYTREDMEKAFSLWQTAPYEETLDAKGIKLRFRNAGHILGSAMVEIWADNRHLLFTGDLGNIPSTLLPPPEVVAGIDILIIESAYGGRTRDIIEDKSLKLERAVEDVATRRGALLIPAFAAERTQDILHMLNEMVLFKRTPEMPVYVDSPLAIKITKVFEKYPSCYRQEIKDLFLKHPNLFRFKKLIFSETTEDSKKINDITPPKVIIAGAGMMTGGRILHHARRYLGDPNSILLMVGYQGSGTLGRKLMEGEKVVKIMGEEVMVRAEIRLAEGFSAHADNRQLTAFVETNRDTLQKIFVVQGEKGESEGFAQQVKDRMGISATAPQMHEEFII